MSFIRLCTVKSENSSKKRKPLKSIHLKPKARLSDVLPYITTEANEEHAHIPVIRKQSRRLLDNSLKVLKDNSSLNTTNSTRHESITTLSNHSLNNILTSISSSSSKKKNKTNCYIRKSHFANQQLPLINQLHHY